MCFEGRLRPRPGPPEWHFCCGGGLDLFRVLEVLEVPGPISLYKDEGRAKVIF